MTLTDRHSDRDLDEERPVRVPQARLAAGDPRCECPAFCPVEHDNDN